MNFKKKKEVNCIVGHPGGIRELVGVEGKNTHMFGDRSVLSKHCSDLLTSSVFSQGPFRCHLFPATFPSLCSFGTLHVDYGPLSKLASGGRLGQCQLLSVNPGGFRLVSSRHLPFV